MFLDVSVSAVRHLEFLGFEKKTVSTQTLIMRSNHGSTDTHARTHDFPCICQFFPLQTPITEKSSPGIFSKSFHNPSPGYYLVTVDSGLRQAPSGAVGDIAGAAASSAACSAHLIRASIARSGACWRRRAARHARYDEQLFA